MSSFLRSIAPGEFSSLLRPGERLLVPVEAGRANNLDFIRFVLAISVLYCHCYVLYYGTEDTVEPLYVWSNKQISIGSFAVNFFFTISGFLVLQSWNNSKGFFSYMKKRILRIYPGFIVASLLCTLVFAPLGTADFFMPFGYWKLYYQNLELLPVLRSFLELSEPPVPWTLKYAPIADTINAPLWTIRYEFLCYLFIPLLAVFGFYRRKIFMLLLFIAAYVSQLFQYYGAVYYFGWRDYMIVGKPDFLPRFLTYFLAGMCFYAYRNTIPRSKFFLAVSVVMLLLSIFFFKGLVCTQPIFGAYLLFYCSFSQTISFRNFSRSGDFSYGVYVYAWPIQQLIILYFEKYLNISLLFILTCALTMIFAYFSWHIIEKPFLNLKKKSQPHGA